VLVIGAGVQGLTTGVVLAEAGWSVRIRTNEPPRETTSAVAGAMWGPALLRPADRVQEWVTRTHSEFVTLAEDGNTGVHLAQGTMAARFDLGDELPAETRLIPDLRRCAPEELPEGFVTGYRATVPLIDMPRYLDYLVDRFTSAGGSLVISPVPTLADAVDDAHFVVNCTGVGARELVGDPGVHPIRGQHVIVDNPGIDEYFLEIGGDTVWASYMPHGDRLVLGGVAKEHDWHREPSREVTAGILQRCSAVNPRLFAAQVRDVMVGLRPGRQAVRLEAEDYQGGHLVHNYGHGGAGVSLSWGCAFEVATLL
jgi:D-amino-acid oxidase